MPIQEFLTGGAANFTTPADFQPGSLVVYMNGAGGNSGIAGTHGTGGAGGGASSVKAYSGLAANTVYPLFVGMAGSRDSFFIDAATQLAKGGSLSAYDVQAGAAGGLASASIGDTKFNGGTGGNGSATSGGGGGGAAGDTGAGGNGGNGGVNVGGTAGASGTGLILPGGLGGVGDALGANTAPQSPGGGKGGRDLAGSAPVVLAIGRVIVSYSTAAQPNYGPSMAQYLANGSLVTPYPLNYGPTMYGYLHP